MGATAAETEGGEEAKMVATGAVETTAATRMPTEARDSEGI